jgi:hypothetical protein
VERIYDGRGVEWALGDRSTWNLTALRETVEIGVTGAPDRPKIASFRLNLGRVRRELATLVAAVFVLPVRVLIRLVEARETVDEVDVLLVVDFLSDEREGGGARGRDDVRGLRPV